MTELSSRVCERVDALRAELEAISRDLHAHPETKFEEHHAARSLRDVMAAHSFAVDQGVAGLEAAFTAEHPDASRGPCIAVLAEYDALPDLGHACGHNLIAASAVGAALALADVKQGLPGRLILMGTPGEEGGGGKVAMVAAGLFDGVDAAMMFHPSTRSTGVDQRSLTRTELRIEFHGKSAHASASPEKGINALDAVIQLFNAIAALRQHIRDGARIHGVITHGGVKPNIIPDYAAASFYVRAADSAYCDELIDRVAACAHGAAQSTGASCDVSKVGLCYQAIRPNAVLTELFERKLRTLGIEPVPPPRDAGLGSTDMADVTQAVPAIHAHIAIADPIVAAHSKEFAEAAISERGHQAMIDAAKAMALSCVDLYTDSELLGNVRRDFEARESQTAR